MVLRWFVRNLCTDSAGKWSTSTGSIGDDNVIDGNTRIASASSILGHKLKPMVMLGRVPKRSFNPFARCGERTSVVVPNFISTKLGAAVDTNWCPVDFQWRWWSISENPKWNAAAKGGWHDGCWLEPGFFTHSFNIGNQSLTNFSREK